MTTSEADQVIAFDYATMMREAKVVFTGEPYVMSLAKIMAERIAHDPGACSTAIHCLNTTGHGQQHGRRPA